MLLVGWPLIHVGWPPTGFKGAAYVWALALTGLLPISLGLNLLRQLLPWRRFAGGWLLALAGIYLAGFALAAPELHHYQLDQLPVCLGLPLLALASVGVLLLRPSRPRDDS